MYSPSRHEVSHTMTNKQRKKVTFPKRSSKPKAGGQKQSKRQNTPFGDVGDILGSAVGKMFNMNLGGAGRWLGTGIGSIFGSGDYTLTGPAPKTNVLVNSAQIPQFSSTRQTNVVCHREYLMDFMGSSNFQNRSFKINPGDPDTFPWLSSIAQNYQEYKFHGLVFEFKPLITDYVTGGAPGVVVMATNYNASDAPYTTKQQMENSEFAVSVKPTHNLMHGVECDVSQTPTPIKYVREGPIPTGQDPKLYDLGLFQFANQGSPTQLLGEIWVSYCVEFFKPILPETIGGSVDSATLGRASADGSNVFGVTQYYKGGTMEMYAAGNTLVWDSLPDMIYLISITWRGAATVLDYPTIALADCVGQNMFEPVSNVGPTFWYTVGADPGLTSAIATLSICVKSTLTAPGVSQMTFSSFVLPATTVAITCTMLDRSITTFTYN